MTTNLPLSFAQRWLLALSKSCGPWAVVALITLTSVVLSVIITGGVLYFVPPDPVYVRISFIVAAVIPLVVAPIASIMVVRLLSALAAAYDDLELLATTDPLTGIANRRRFFKAAASLLADRREDEAVIVGMIDIDRFKALNDSHGHAAGDKTLFLLGQRLQLAVGVYGVVGRLGGDEFGVLLSLTEDRLSAVTDALHAACVSIEVEPGLVVDASLGLCEVLEVDTVDKAMAEADQALYEAKALSRSRLDELTAISRSHRSRPAR